MKKVIGMLMMVVLVGVMCGCTRASESGKVTYQLGTAKMKLTATEDLARWDKIQKIYVKALQGIEGATIDTNSNGAIQMEGLYDDTDAAVVKACEAAEKSAESITLSQGYIVLEVSATYWSGATSEVVYSHTFGKP